MCDIKLNSTDYGVILIKKICKKLQPKIEHLKTAISGVKNTDEQRIIIFRLISWAWENIGSSVKQWKQLAKDFITTYAKEIACCLQSEDPKSGTIDIPRNKRMLLYCFVSQLLDEGVFGECSRNRVICFLKQHFVLQSDDDHIYNSLMKFRKKEDDNLIFHARRYMKEIQNSDC